MAIFSLEEAMSQSFHSKDRGHNIPRSQAWKFNSVGKVPGKILFHHKGLWKFSLIRVAKLEANKAMARHHFSAHDLVQVNSRASKFRSPISPF